MTDYGVFANLGATVSSLVAVTTAILLGFQKRARWQPPQEAVPFAVSRFASLMTALGVGLLYVFAGQMERWVLASLAVGLFIVAFAALLVAISVNIRHSYYYPARAIEKNRTLGGDQLTAEAAGIQHNKGCNPQQMLEDAKGKKDLVWTRKSQASVAIRSTLSFVILIGAGGCCLAATGMLVVTTIAQ